MKHHFVVKSLSMKQNEKSSSSKLKVYVLSNHRYNRTEGKT